MAHRASFCILLLCSIGHATGARIKALSMDPESPPPKDKKFSSEQCKRYIMEKAEEVGFRIGLFLGPMGCSAGTLSSDGKLTETGLARMCADTCLANEDLAMPPPNFDDLMEACSDSSMENLKIAKESLPIHDYLQGIWENCGKEEGDDDNKIEEVEDEVADVQEIEDSVPEVQDVEDEDVEDENRPERVPTPNWAPSPGKEDDDLTWESDTEGDSGDNAGDNGDNAGDNEDITKPEDLAPIPEDEEVTEPVDEVEPVDSDGSGEKKPGKATQVELPPIVPIEALKPSRNLIKQMQLAYNFAGALAMRSKKTCSKLRKVFSEFDYRHTGRLTAEQVVENLDLLSDGQKKEAMTEFRRLQETSMHEDFVTFMDVVNTKLDVTRSLRCYRAYATHSDDSDI